MKTKSIVLVHGLFVNNESWKEWKIYFEKLGYTVHTPSNPYHEGKVSDLRENIHPDLHKTGFEDYLNNLIDFIDQLPEKPIAIGHSFGGLMVMKLVEMNKVVAGISIDGAPPKNVIAPFQTIKTVLPAVNIFKKGAYMGTKDWYHYAFFNNYSKAESDKLYDLMAVPESKKVSIDALTKSIAKVDFKKAHQPILFIGGEKDHIFPTSFTKKIANSYKDKNSVSDYKSFEGRSHFICGEEGWEEVADYIQNWIQKLKE